VEAAQIEEPPEIRRIQGGRDLHHVAGARAERLLVLTDANGPLALTVDRLRSVINVDLVRGTLTRSESEADCISAVLSWQEEMISLLNLNQLQQLLEQLCSRTGG